MTTSWRVRKMVLAVYVPHLLFPSLLFFLFFRSHLLFGSRSPFAPLSLLFYTLLHALLLCIYLFRAHTHLIGWTHYIFALSLIQFVQSHSANVLNKRLFYVQKCNGCYILYKYIAFRKLDIFFECFWDDFIAQIKHILNPLPSILLL